MSTEKQILFEAHTDLRNEPRNLKETDRHLFEHELKKQIRATYCFNESNVLLLRDSLYKNSKFLTKYAHYHGMSWGMTLKRLLMLFSPAQTIDKAAWISDIWSDGFFHYFGDAMPRILAVKDLLGDRPILLPAYFEGLEYIKRSIEKLGINVIYFDQTKKIQIKDLLIVSHTADMGNYNKELIHQIREQIGISPQKEPWRSVYVSRAKQPKRRVTNEEAFVSLLKEHKFEVHYFEEYNFDEQLQIMSETKVLLGVHGAGLTNMLFMPAKGSCIELRNANDNENNCYFSMASNMGMDYYYQVCQGTQEDTHRVDIEVDLSEMKKILEAISQAGSVSA